ncbi:MAG: TRAP transporter substrate-binding protein [Anaerovoracaceae bacterium]
MKKKVLSVALSLVLILTMCLAFSGCGGSGSDSGEAEQVVIHFGSSQGTTHAWYEAATAFKDTVEKESGGSVTIQIDFGGAWGTDKDHAEQVQSGALDMYIGSTVGADAVVNEIGFVNLPYFINSYEKVDELIYNGWVGETITKDMENAGFKMLGLTDCDFRWISNSKHEINSAADLKGLKMRVPETPMFLKFFEALGANPTSMAFTELPSALQQGTVDGQDNGPVLSYTNGLHEFNKYWVKSNHSFAAAVVVMNQGKWDSLSADQQEVIAAAAEQYCLDIRTLIREDVEEMTQKMIDAGCEVIEVSDQLDKDMRAAAEKVWADDEATKTFDQEAVARIRQEAGIA